MDDIHLLYLEDSKVSRGLMAKAVEPIAHCHGAETLAEARQAMAERLYNFFILDYELPDGDGISFAREIRENAEYVQTPILLYASSVDNELAFAAMKAGINESIQKPMAPMELCQHIVAQLELPEIKHVRRELLQLTCMKWRADGKHHHYSPDLNLHMTGADPHELELQMQQRIESELRAKATPEDYPADISLVRHIVQLRREDDEAA